jgi:hypothetical protein
MEALIHLHDLQGLDLSRTEVTDNGLEVLANSRDLVPPGETAGRGGDQQSCFYGVPIASLCWPNQRSTARTMLAAPVP